MRLWTKSFSHMELYDGQWHTLITHLTHTSATQTQMGQTLVYCIHCWNHLFFEVNNNNSHIPQLWIHRNRSFCNSNLCSTQACLYGCDLNSRHETYVVVGLSLMFYFVCFYDITHYMHTHNIWEDNVHGCKQDVIKFKPQRHAQLYFITCQQDTNAQISLKSRFIICRNKTVTNLSWHISTFLILLSLVRSKVHEPQR